MITIADMILRQKEFHNGHGQMEISEMSLDDLREVVRDLQRKGGLQLWYVKLYEEAEGKMSASVYEENGILQDNGISRYRQDKLWFGVENVVLGEG